MSKSQEELSAEMDAAFFYQIETPIHPAGPTSLAAGASCVFLKGSFKGSTHCSEYVEAACSPCGWMITIFIRL